MKNLYQKLSCLLVFTSICAVIVFSISAIATSKNGLPSAEDIDRVCKFVTTADEDSYLKNGFLDINNDGLPENVFIKVVGTARAEIHEVIDESGKYPNRLDWVNLDDRDRWGYGTRILPFDKSTYLVRFSDSSLRYPLSVRYIAPPNKLHVVCRFSQSVSTSVNSLLSEEDDFCRSLLADRNPYTHPVSEEPLSHQLENTTLYSMIPGEELGIERTDPSQPDINARPETSL